MELWDREAMEEEEKHKHHLEETHEEKTKATIVLSLMGLVVTFVVAFLLESVHFHYLPEAGVAVIVGMVLAGVAKAYHGELEQEPAQTLIEIMKFDFEFFMVCLLPPIIFEAGYNMRRGPFFNNIGPTMLYAFIGTFTSCFVVGGIVWWAGLMGYCHPLGGLASLLFGSLISATDPVTVLAVFQALGVKIDLFSMVFGESVLNDAVAIVLSKTLMGFKSEPLSTYSVLAAVYLFSKIFFCSLLIGAVMGVLCALTFLKTGMAHHKGLMFMEAALSIVFPWCSYYIAEALELSGIVAILFCGITMAHYATDSMSSEANRLTKKMYKVAATFAETFVFIYLGMAVFSFAMFDHLVWKLVLIAMVACAIGRFLNIYPNSAIANAGRTDPHLDLPPISPQYQFLMWFSGLRGGVAFAIASKVYADRAFADINPGASIDDGLAILQTTLYIALFTIFVMGGTITDLCEYYNVLDKNANPDDDIPKGKPTGFRNFDQKFIKPYLTQKAFVNKLKARVAMSRRTDMTRQGSSLREEEGHGHRPPLS